MIRIIIN